MINQKQFRVPLFQTQPYIQLARVYRPIFSETIYYPNFHDHRIYINLSAGAGFPGIHGNQISQVRGIWIVIRF